METTPENSRLTLHEAAHLLPAPSIHDAELELAHAIEDGRLHANVKRWATEQWESGLLPGNINRLETWIERSDFDDWMVLRQGASDAGMSG